MYHYFKPFSFKIKGNKLIYCRFFLFIDESKVALFPTITVGNLEYPDMKEVELRFLTARIGLRRISEPINDTWAKDKYREFIRSNDAYINLHSRRIRRQERKKGGR